MRTQHSPQKQQHFVSHLVSFSPLPHEALVVKTWIPLGPLPKYHQNLVYIFNGDHEFMVLKVCMFHLTKRHLNLRELWSEAVNVFAP